MRPPAHLIALLLAVGVLAASAAASPAPDAQPAGFRQAEGTRTWRFPRDHGQHPAYRLEWWYYTGIVRTAGGRVFGYQVTFFRQGVREPGAQEPPRRSAWAVRSLYLAQVALSDIAGQRYLHASRASRDSLGLSGAAPDRMQVWVESWRADPLQDSGNGARLRVDAGNFALSLTLRAERDPVLNGQGGLDRKGAEPGQASWYYSLPRMATEGTVRVDGDSFAVSGTTWMDHEFGTSQLGPQLAGWDWMGLRLDDGSDLMLYRLRRTDGGTDPHSGGIYVAPDGRRSRIVLTSDGAGRATLAPGRMWHSARSGADYPLEWELALPGQGLHLHLSPAFDAQEQTATAGTPFAYWEGAVGVHGTRNGRPIRGEGYLELTGYAGRLGGALR
ncbi:MAG TPA: lipocalin-like domain-containing protein [bacterium]|nr:lipocalin-like domain-containing protein [bacterium]